MPCTLALAPSKFLCHALHFGFCPIQVYFIFVSPQVLIETYISHVSLNLKFILASSSHKLQKTNFPNLQTLNPNDVNT